MTTQRPREWWLVRNPTSNAYSVHEEKPSWDSIMLGNERIHVIEKSAHDSVVKVRDLLIGECNNWKSEHDNLSKFAEDLRKERDEWKAKCLKAWEECEENDLRTDDP